MKLFLSGTNRWIFVMLMFLPIFITNLFTLTFFALKSNLFGVMFIIWNTCYIAFWTIIAIIINVSASNLFASKYDYLIMCPSEGKPRVVMSGGHEYKKVGAGRPQSYILCDTKPNNIHIPSGIVFSANETDDTLTIREIDVIDQIENKVYIRGYFEYDKNTHNFSNHLDISALPAQMSLLSLELNMALKSKLSLESLYERADQKLFDELNRKLDDQAILSEAFARTLEKTNHLTGLFSGTNTQLRNREIDAKMGSDARTNASIDEKLDNFKKQLLKELMKND